MERTTLAQFRTEARLYADERTSGFLTDTGGSLDAILHAKIRKVRSWVCQRTGGSSWFDERANFTTAAGTSLYCLDTSGTETSVTTYPVSQVRELTVNWSSTNRERVEMVSEAEAENLGRLTWGQWSTKGAILRGRYLQLLPAPSSAVGVTIVYLPTYNELGTADTLYAPDGFREAVVLEAAIRIRGMQDEPTAALEAQRKEAYETLGAVVATRTPTFGPRVLNVSPERTELNPDDLLPPA